MACGEIIAVYSDRSTPNASSVGYVKRVAGGLVLIDSLTPGGGADGTVVRRLRDIFKVEVGGVYHRSLGPWVPCRLHSASRPCPAAGHAARAARSGRCFSSRRHAGASCPCGSMRMTTRRTPAGSSSRAPMGVSSLESWMTTEGRMVSRPSSLQTSGRWTSAVPQRGGWSICTEHLLMSTPGPSCDGAPAGPARRFVRGAAICADPAVKITWGRQVRRNPLHLTPYD